MVATISIQDLLDEIEERDKALDRLVATCMKLETENQQLRSKIDGLQSEVLSLKFGIGVSEPRKSETRLEHGNLLQSPIGSHTGRYKVVGVRT